MPDSIDNFSPCKCTEGTFTKSSIDVRGRDITSSITKRKLKKIS